MPFTNEPKTFDLRRTSWPLVLILGFLLSSPICCRPQPSGAPSATSFISTYRSISYRDGLSGHAPHSSLISRDGYLWVYTEKCLNLYNGFRAKTYPQTARPSLDHWNALLVEAPDSAIWAGSYKPARRNRQLLGDDLQLRVVQAGKRSSLPFDSVYQDIAPFSSNSVVNLISESGPGSPVYLCTRQGKVYRYNGEQFELVLAQNVAEPINAVLPGRDGTYWIGQPGRVEHINQAGQVLESYDMAQSPMLMYWAGPEVIGFYDWIPAFQDTPKMLFRLLYPGEGPRDHLQLETGATLPIRSAQVVQYQKEGFWHLLMADDWIVIDAKNGTRFSFLERHPEKANNYLTHLLPNQLYFDQEGVAYATLYAEVLALKVSKNPFRQIHTRGGHSLRSMVQPSPDTLILSAYTGIHGYDLRRRRHFTLNDNYTEAWLSVLKLRTGKILAASHSKRLKIFSTDGQIMQRIGPQKPIGQHLTIPALYQDEEGMVWIGTSRGLAKYRPGAPHFSFCETINQDYGLHEVLIRSIRPRGKTLWLGTDQGLYSLDLKTQEVLRHLPERNVSINYTYWADEHTCWIATDGEGIWKWQPGTGELAIYDKAQFGLPNDVIHAIYPAQEYLWFTTNDGLVWMAPESEEYGYYTWQNGLPDNEFNYTSHLQLADGSFVFGGISGAVHFHPDSIGLKKMSRTPIRVVYFGVPDRHTGLLQDHTPLWEKRKTVELSPTSNMACHFRFHLGSYLPLEQQRYDYRIDDQHESWQPMTGNHLVISSLPYGRYNLRVRGKAAPDQTGSEELSIPIVVKRPYYETAWFWLLVVAAVVAAGFALFQLRLRQLKNSEQKLKEEVARRTQKIAANQKTILTQNQELERLNKGKDKVMSIIGHELRNNLFFIGGASRQIRRALADYDYQSVEALSRNIRLAATRMDNIIENLTRWAMVHSGRMPINLAPLSPNDLIRGVLEEHRPLAERKDIQLQLRLQETPPIQADANAIRISLQNLLRNAIKFTDQAGTIVLRTRQEGGHVVFEVCDNGTGVAPEVLDRLLEGGLLESKTGTSGEVGTGLGLSITKELVEQQGGKLTAESREGKGSTFAILMPAPAAAKSTIASR